MLAGWGTSVPTWGSPYVSTIDPTGATFFHAIFQDAGPVQLFDATWRVYVGGAYFTDWGDYNYWGDPRTLTDLHTERGELARIDGTEHADGCRDWEDAWA